MSKAHAEMMMMREFETDSINIIEERKEDYGDASESFERIASFWSGYLKGRGLIAKDKQLTKRDVAALMVLLKVSRASTSDKFDSWLDMESYAKLGKEMV